MGSEVEWLLPVWAVSITYRTKERRNSSVSNSQHSLPCSPASTKMRNSRKCAEPPVACGRCPVVDRGCARARAGDKATLVSGPHGNMKEWGGPYLSVSLRPYRTLAVLLKHTPSATIRRRSSSVTSPEGAAICHRMRPGDQTPLWQWVWRRPSASRRLRKCGRCTCCTETGSDCLTKRPQLSLDVRDRHDGALARPGMVPRLCTAPKANAQGPPR